MTAADDFLHRFYTTPPDRVLIVLAPLLIGAAVYDVRYRRFPTG